MQIFTSNHVDKEALAIRFSLNIERSDLNAPHISRWINNTPGNTRSQRTTVNPVEIRKIQPRDVTMLADMHRHCSDQSMYWRYLRPYRPNWDELEEICQIRNLPLCHQGDVVS